MSDPYPASETAEPPREGERALPFDPAVLPADAGVVFIGRVRSPWRDRAACPKNMREARERGQTATVELDPVYADGLAGIEGFSHLVILTWLDGARRDLIVQRPRHAATARGTFALRSPVRPNPVGLHVARLLHVDGAVLTLEGIDVLDGTPVIDVKPYFASTDAVPEAAAP
jgi:tRNA-Thr(GGU) m(6)t(6)A37 methyltransferase TsaA